jgi:hypothetical protein
VLVCVFTSQPSAGMLLQLPNPELHVPSVQLPVEHDSLAFARLHAVPQPPQLVSVLSVVSQPLPPLPSQSPRPLMQLAVPHTPLTQFGVPPAVEQALPQVLQWLTFVLRLISQPLAVLPSQFAKPALQPITQLPDGQVGDALALPQMLPQPPQFVVVLMSDVSQPLAALPSQFPQLASQVPSVHTPPTQLSPA